LLAANNTRSSRSSSSKSKKGEKEIRKKRKYATVMRVIAGQFLFVAFAILNVIAS